jgi:hypothetical protein
VHIKNVKANEIAGFGGLNFFVGVLSELPTQMCNKLGRLKEFHRTNGNNRKGSLFNVQ